MKRIFAVSAVALAISCLPAGATMVGSGNDQCSGTWECHQQEVSFHDEGDTTKTELVWHDGIVIGQIGGDHNKNPSKWKHCTDPALFDLIHAGAADGLPGYTIIDDETMRVDNGDIMSRCRHAVFAHVEKNQRRPAGWWETIYTQEHWSRDWTELIEVCTFNPPGPSPVPDPSTILMFGSGLAGVAGLYRGRRNGR